MIYRRIILLLIDYIMIGGQVWVAFKLQTTSFGTKTCTVMMRIKYLFYDILPIYYYNVMYYRLRQYGGVNIQYV